MAPNVGPSVRVGTSFKQPRYLFFISRYTFLTFAINLHGISELAFCSTILYTFYPFQHIIFSSDFKIDFRADKTKVTPISSHNICLQFSSEVFVSDEQFWHKKNHSELATLYIDAFSTVLICWASFPNKISTARFTCYHVHVISIFHDTSFAPFILRRFQNEVVSISVIMCIINYNRAVRTLLSHKPNQQVCESTKTHRLWWKSDRISVNLKFHLSHYNEKLLQLIEQKGTSQWHDVN